MNQQEKFVELVKKFRVAMLTTAGFESPFHSRPMAIAKVEDNGEVWFFTAGDSLKTIEIDSASDVVVTCQDDRSTYLSLYGKARALRDDVKVKELWKEPYRVWFPDGPDDSSLMLLHVVPVRGEFWDTQGLNKAKYIFESIKGYVTKTTPKLDDGEIHAKVSL